LHRDLKLANILLTSENVEEAAVKIGDFGFARFLTDSLAGT
jgi:serine/threonine protein kinase